MLRRRFLVGGAVSAAVATPAFAKSKVTHTSSSAAEQGSYAAFLAGVRREAISKGLSASVVDDALALTSEPNAKVLKADRHQPEFTLTWAQYKARVITDKKISDGQAAVNKREALLGKVSQLYGVDRGVIAGIWGLESAYGTKMGTFHVVDALATLAYDGRRAAFFRTELFKALTILGQGDITPAGMLGSYAGAMGQPQFMPSAYEQYAASFPVGGRRDIWTNEGDVFASIANYLAKCHWIAGQPWGEAVDVPDSIDQGQIGRTIVRPVSYWATQGVRPQAGGDFTHMGLSGAIIRPDGVGGEAYMVYHNFNVIRRYNPSDFYALGVGLLGSAVA
ncbi:lytic murein transglycosylase [Acetobacter cerevisiae]|uniref:Lytic murein transglycosylase n=1 Tax=Acetobacter cerevisiae TaxID=178900 RepID=A0A149UYY6_9PROT|nr:lytic murein transglycosylase [Acetobacter cerevisiae]KXV73132.1 lytic transglycosylase [Acetobacter cerevisiae]MCP1244573.1 lytic murein transglycosylase [Acetobacter cerevisiae]MCP1254150.1 lytic murein transglycosylase [Acetobacter cerevisiae]